jgi:hypothetical protein
MAKHRLARIPRFRSALTDHMPIRHIGIIAIDIIIGTGIIDIGIEQERTNREAKTVVLEQCRLIRTEANKKPPSFRASGPFCVRHNGGSYR